MSSCIMLSSLCHQFSIHVVEVVSSLEDSNDACGVSTNKKYFEKISVH
jgi:hypothetical protein